MVFTLHLNIPSIASSEWHRSKELERIRTMGLWPNLNCLDICWNLITKITFDCCFKYYTYPWNSSAANKESGRCCNKLFVDNYFSLLQLFLDIHSRKINGCGSVHHNRLGMPKKFQARDLETEESWHSLYGEGGTSAVCQKDKRKAYLLTNTHNPQLCGKKGNASKPLCTESYNTSTGFVIWMIWWQTAVAFPVRCRNGLESSYSISLTYPKYLQNHVGGKLTYNCSKNNS
jgi:hypothetical protein